MCDKAQAFQCEDCHTEVEVPSGLFQLVDDYRTLSSLVPIKVPCSSTTLKEAIVHARNTSLREWNESLYSIIDFLQPFDEQVLWRILPPPDNTAWYFEAVGDWGQGAHTIPCLLEEESEEQKNRRLLASLYFYAFGSYRWNLIVEDCVLYKFIGAPESITVEELSSLSIRHFSKTCCERLGRLDLWGSMRRLLLHRISSDTWQNAELYIKWAVGDKKGSWNYRVLKDKNADIAFEDLVLCNKKVLVASQCTMRCIRVLGDLAKAFKTRYGEIDTLWPSSSLTWSWLRSVEKSRLPLALPMVASGELRRSR